MSASKKSAASPEMAAQLIAQTKKSRRKSIKVNQITTKPNKERKTFMGPRMSVDIDTDDSELTIGADDSRKNMMNRRDR